MKPFRIFIFFSAVLVLLLCVSLLFPRQGIGIGGDLRLKFISLTDLNSNDSTNASAEVERLLAASTVTDDPESDPGTDLISGVDLISETEEDSKDFGPKVIPANADQLKQEVYRIQFADDNAAPLHPYFRNLDHMASGQTDQRGQTGPTRILHFGDSQIENDRMTALIRYRMQRLFGGTGTGLVQAIPLYSGSLAYRQEEEGAWLRYTYFGNRDSTIAHKSYGIMGAFASVPTPEEDTWPMLHYRFNTSRRSGQVRRIRVFMHSYVEGASLAFKLNEDFSDTIRGIPDGFSVADFNHYEELKEARIYFNLPEGGRIYGISFESVGGIQVDNIAMRGGSGLIFTSMNRFTQQAMLDELDPGLILLQYGGNVVPYMSSSYYRRAFKRQLKFFRELCPGIPVIVIGPSDMAIRENSHFVTYPGLEGIRNALRDAALESGFGFWDLYEAMGGHNSMASFVHADPPLASTDYVHFTNLGVNLVAEMFYNALMLEYKEFETQIANR
jgi:hypothetical protein